MNDCLRLRVVLRESNAGAIYRVAQAASDPHSPQYGRYAEREQVRGWGNPADDERARVLEVFADFKVDEVGTSPLLFVTGKFEALAALFKEGTLERFGAGKSGGLQVPAWEWAGKLVELQSFVKSIHAVGCDEPAPEELEEDEKKAPKLSHQREIQLEYAPKPNRGWMFSHLVNRKRRERVPHQHEHRHEEHRIEAGATPNIIRYLYDFPENVTGRGQTIAFMSLGSSGSETRELINADLRKFWKAWGVPDDARRVSYVTVGPAETRQLTSPLVRLEATMGPAWLGALLPEAKIVIYEMALDLPDPWLAAVEMAVADGARAPNVLCITWTQPEESYYRQYSRSSISLALAKAAALGITVVVGAGDWGVYDGRPGSTWQQNGSSAKVARAAWPHATFPSTEERVLSVGGTLVTALNPITEIGWSGPLPPDPELARELPFISLATSGGFSQRVPIPDWQYDSVASVWSPRIYSRGTNLPAVLPYGRGFPDVSLMAAGPALARGNPPGLSATGYQLVIDGKWIEYAGGTSLAAPIWAALIASFNEERARQGREPLGFVNPLLYYLARTRPLSGPHAILRPINDGSSDIEFRVVTGEGQTTRHVLSGYEARADWDPVTGLGVPRAARLAQELAAYPRAVTTAPLNRVEDRSIAATPPAPPPADVLEGV